jgi:hypothetical protein
MPKRELSPEEREKNRLRSNAWAAANREKARLRAKEWYEANKDRAKGTFKAKVASDPAAYREKRKRHYTAKREEINAARAALPSDHPARKAAAERARQWAVANADRKREADRLYYDTRRDEVLASVRAYRAANPEKMRALGARKKATLAKRTPKWLTADDWKAIEAFYAEAVRLTKETGMEWHVDHIIPLRGKTVSGLHVPGNLRVIPAEENMRKTNSFDPDLLTLV